MDLGKLFVPLEVRTTDLPFGDQTVLTAPTDKRVIKWIKGALIGSGSFGSVYLGMDAQHGLLMAVKQVALPKGNSANEERKKSMLSALEREIALLKELQHEYIVQYLGEHCLCSAKNRCSHLLAQTPPLTTST